MEFILELLFDIIVEGSMLRVQHQGHGLHSDLVHL